MLRSMIEVTSIYIKKFWVGLMDGDGSIQVNQWFNTYLQYRLVIKLKYTESNFSMLTLIAKNIGGNVKMSGSFVLWFENDKMKILEIIKIFDTYPPLTTRVMSQLLFLKGYLFSRDVKAYLIDRNNKYKNQSQLIASMNYLECVSRSYYKEWLSGFIEAEGCFCVRENGNHSFSIGQKDDLYLIESIKNYFGVSTNVRIIDDNFFLLEFYKKNSLVEMLIHFKSHPLLGDKKDSYSKFLKALV
jgi:hypothetical protein